MAAKDQMAAKRLKVIWSGGGGFESHCHFFSEVFSDQIQRIGVIPYTNKMTLGSQCVSLTWIAKQLGECARMAL